MVSARCSSKINGFIEYSVYFFLRYLAHRLEYRVLFPFLLAFLCLFLSHSLDPLNFWNLFRDHHGLEIDDVCSVDDVLVLDLSWNPEGDLEE